MKTQLQGGQTMTGNEIRALMKNSPDNAQKVVFTEYYNYVYTIVYNKLRSYAAREDMEECVSDIFAELFLKLDSDFRFDGDLAAYVNVIAKNKAIDMYRSLSAQKNSFLKVAETEIASLPSDTDIAAQTESNEIRKIVIDMIEKLGEPDSSIIILKYYYGRNSNEISRKLSISPATVRKRSERALKRLKKLLSENNIMDQERFQ